MPVLPAGQSILGCHCHPFSYGFLRHLPREIVGLMLMTMDLDIQKNLEQLGAYDMLKELKTLYAQQAGTSLNRERISRMSAGRRTVCKLLRSENEESLEAELSLISSRVAEEQEVVSRI
ncbi:hypothetical protein Tco_0152277 [Tanacetum coccineum]